jgi:hypothetical protein
LEHVYKEEEDFKKFSKKLSAVKVSDAMRKTGCLLPPRRRSVARFMNLSAIIVRATNMLRIFPTLNGEEQKTFKFVLTCRQLIEETGCVFKTVNALLKDIKKQRFKLLTYGYIHTAHKRMPELEISTGQAGGSEFKSVSARRTLQTARYRNLPECLKRYYRVHIRQIQIKALKKSPERCNILCFNLTAANQNGSRGQTLSNQFQGFSGKGFYEGFNRLVQE